MNVSDEIVDLLEKGQSISAMIILKERHGYSLFQAKHTIEIIIDIKYGGMTEWRDHMRRGRIKNKKARVA